MTSLTSFSRPALALILVLRARPSAVASGHTIDQSRSSMAEAAKSTASTPRVHGDGQRVRLFVMAGASLDNPTRVYILT